MQPSLNCLKLIKGSEGFRSSRYLCPGGFWTIGFGHKLTREDFDSNLDNITKKKALELFYEDTKEASQAVSRLVTITLNQNEFDALVSFVYNVGQGAFQKSTLLSFLNKGDKKNAADQFLVWVYASGRKQDGLIERRKNEKELFET